MKYNPEFIVNNIAKLYGPRDLLLENCVQKRFISMLISNEENFRSSRITLYTQTEKKKI